MYKNYEFKIEKIQIKLGPRMWEIKSKLHFHSAPNLNLVCVMIQLFG